MQPVESSNVVAVGYNTETMTLYITYKSGGSYAYKQVPKETYESLLVSDSKGRYLAGMIKGRFAHRVAKEEELPV